MKAISHSQGQQSRYTYSVGNPKSFLLLVFRKTQGEIKSFADHWFLLKSSNVYGKEHGPDICVLITVKHLRNLKF